MEMIFRLSSMASVSARSGLRISCPIHNILQSKFKSSADHQLNLCDLPLQISTRPERSVCAVANSESYSSEEPQLSLLLLPAPSHALAMTIRRPDRLRHRYNQRLRHSLLDG